MGVAPLVAVAQPARKVRRIGFLSLDTSSSVAGQLVREDFPKALNALGYRENENLVIEWRWADGKTENLSGLAEDLVRMKVDVIVARTNGPIRAAKQATQTIPIVMFNGNFPVEEKFIESLARPGGNVTGTSYMAPSMYQKHLQILKELAPRTDRVAVLWSANNTGSPLEQVVKTSLQRGATALGIAVQYFDVRQPAEIAAALNRIATSGSNAFLYLGTPILRGRSAEIMVFLRNHRLASVGVIPTFAEDGGLAHYAPDTRGFVDRTASYVDRILKGGQPSDLPVEEPTKFELVINLKTARALGLTVPQSLLISADRVIS